MSQPSSVRASMLPIDPIGGRGFPGSPPTAVASSISITSACDARESPSTMGMTGIGVKSARSCAIGPPRRFMLARIGPSALSEGTPVKPGFGEGREIAAPGRPQIVLLTWIAGDVEAVPCAIGLRRDELSRSTHHAPVFEGARPELTAIRHQDGLAGCRAAAE